MKILSINSKNTVDTEHVAFNIEAPPVARTVQYGTLVVRIEDGLLKVTMPSDEELIDSETLQTIVKKFEAADAKAAADAEEAERRMQRALDTLARATNLPID